MSLTLTSPYNFKSWAAALAFFMATGAATGQELHYRDLNDPQRGYWTLFTDASSQTTHIQFFNADKRLVYEESIPEKYIRLTRRNINKINQAFDRIMEQKLLKDQVKLSELSSARYRKLVRRHKSEARTSTDSFASCTSTDNLANRDDFECGIQTTAYPLSNNKLYFQLTILNPLKERLFIFLYDTRNNSIYRERIYSINYRRTFNMEALRGGVYKLLVTNTNRKYKYIRYIEVKPSRRSRMVYIE